MTLQWRDGMSVGNDVIDTDHKFLIDIINQVERSMGSEDREQLTEALETLDRYAQAHFRREEKIAQAAGYTEVTHLHASHQTLVKQLAQLKLEVKEQWSEKSIESFGALLRQWLVDHVIKEDLLLKPALKNFPANFDPK